MPRIVPDRWSSWARDFLQKKKKKEQFREGNSN
jgi:hypothetical protein